ncbi:MAG: SRPBCC domain-containing protein [candidate division Zixibacteria bacterium]
MTQPYGHDIKQRTFIAVPPERVYETITSGDGWNAFFTHATEIDPKPGGKMVFRWKDWGPDRYTNNSECKVLKADHPTLFEFEWGMVGRGFPSTVRFHLEANDGGTVVTLTESGYPDTDKARSSILSCACGWGEAVTLLKFWLEHGVRYAG